MSKEKQSALIDSVMSQIKRGDVQMKPKVYYTLLGAIAAGTVVLAGIMTTYLSSIMFFWLRIQTADTMARGARANLRESISSFPWWLLVCTALSLALVVFIVRRYGRLYKHRAGALVVLLVLISLVFGLLLSFFNVGKQHTPYHTNERGQRQGQFWQRNY